MRESALASAQAHRNSSSSSSISVANQSPMASLWPPGVVQRSTSQPHPQHVVQHPRAPIVGWQSLHHQQQQQQQQQFGWLLAQQQHHDQQQWHFQQQEPHWDALQYVLQQQHAPMQQPCTLNHRGFAVVAAAAAAAAAASGSSAADVTACWPAATFNSIADVVDLQHELVQWPQDKQPKLGHITRNKLRKLTAVELRAELSRLQGPDSKGLKEDLINTLLGHLLHPNTAAAAAAAAEPVVLTAQGAQLLQQVAPGLCAAAQGSSSSKLGLQQLAQCQVVDLCAALSAAWPLVGPSLSISQQQLLQGSAADLVQRLLLCLATCAGMDQASIQKGLAAATPPAQQQGQQPEQQASVQPARGSDQPADLPSSSSSKQAKQQPGARSPAPSQQLKDQIRQQLEASLLLSPRQSPAPKPLVTVSGAQQQLQQQQSPPPQQQQSLPPQQPQQQPQQGEAAANAELPPGYTQPHGPVVVPGTMPPFNAAEAARVAAAVGVDLEELPPLPQQARGHVYDLDLMTSFSDQEREMVLKSNRAGLAFTLVGGAADGALTGDSSSRCLALLRERDAWLFDVGEDTQRLLMWQEHLRPSKMHRIAVSRQSPDALLGLPGVLCIIGSSREKGHEKADIPVHVFGPEGTTEFLSTMYDCGNTYLEMPVVVHEFVHHAVSKEEMAPQLFNPRSKLWRVLLPPDQLNPDGFVDARLDNFDPMNGRAWVKAGTRAAGGVLAKNPRAGYRPLPLPPAGDPTLQGLARADMTWTVAADEAAMLTAVAVEADDLTWAMVWREADKQGNLSVPRCQALKINNGELYGVLKAGEAVPNEDGITIPAYLVCTQDKPGRKVVLLPACDSAASLGSHAAQADIMFADAAAARQAAPGHPVGAAVGRCAREWGVRTLVTTAMPQSAEAMRAHNLENNSFNPAWRQRRLRTGAIASSSSSSSSSRASDSEDEADVLQQQQQHGEEGDDAAEGQQQQQVLQPADPELAAFLQAVAREYDCGQLVPGRDCLSLIVEENSGSAPPPPLDIKAKEQDARATSLVMCADALDQGAPKRQEQPKQRQQGGYRGRPTQQQQQHRSGQYQQRQGGQGQHREWRERSVAR